MKIFGIIILTIMTGGIYGIVYAATRKKRKKEIDELEKVTIRTTYAFTEFKKLSEEDQKTAENLRQALDNMIKLEDKIIN